MHQTNDEAPWEPIPEALARWTGSLLYWVTSSGEQFYARAVAPLGLRPPQVGLLQVLAGEGPTPQARLTDKTRIDKASLVGLLNDLEAQGLVRRHPHPDDRRAFVIHLEEAGRERLRRVEAVSAEADRRFFGALSEDERRLFQDMLRRLATRRPDEGADGPQETPGQK